jgi:hypothetical protein
VFIGHVVWADVGVNSRRHSDRLRPNSTFLGKAMAGAGYIARMPARYFIKNREELAAYIKSVGRGLVVFDGRPGSGKTYLADDMARRTGCKSADADRDFLDHDKGKFVGALRLDDMRSSLTASLASSPLVMYSTVCARQAIVASGLSAAAFIWVEKASLALIGNVQRDFDDYDDYRDEPSQHVLYAEVEAYIAAYDARRRLDQVVYVNAYEGS